MTDKDNKIGNNMGYIKHNAILVTTYSESDIDHAYEIASGIFGMQNVTGKIMSVTNGYFSFLIPPDGSKENWTSSRIGDVRRNTFMEWCAEQAYEDLSNNICAVELTYGGESGETSIDDISYRAGNETYDFNAFEYLKNRNLELEHTLRYLRDKDVDTSTRRDIIREVIGNDDEK
jgi:hypothetical protein